MLQLRHRVPHFSTDVSNPRSNLATPHARRSTRGVSAGQQSKVGSRNRSLTLQAHRGEEVAAFLVTQNGSEAGTPPSPPPSAVSRQLLVYTTEGARSSVTVLPGVTTVRQLRAQVAQATRTDPAQVRVSYAGKELPASLDASLLQLKPGIDVVAALQRFQGGGAAAAGRSGTSAVDGAPSSDTCAAAAAAAAAADLMAPDQPAPAAVAEPLAGAASADTCDGTLADAAAAAAATTVVERGHSRRRRPTAAAERESKLAWAAASPDVVPDRRRKSAGRVPGGRQGCSSELQLARQFRDLMQNPIPGINAAPSDDDLFEWTVQLAGPEGSPYEGGWFNVQLEFTEDFPGEQPCARFMTQIWHPNVSDHFGGRACASFGSHNDVCSITCVLAGLQILLASPNPKSLLNYECASQMLAQPRQFEAQARRWTQLFAMDACADAAQEAEANAVRWRDYR